jgi:uncharacterized protein YjiS (DUF1127 family)
MVHLLSSERPSMAAASSNPFVALVKWFANARAKRARRLALRSLLDYDPHQLADIGVTRSDLFEAIQSDAANPGLRLARKRAKTSQDWLGR